MMGSKLHFKYLVSKGFVMILNHFKKLGAHWFISIAIMNVYKKGGGGNDTF